MNLEEYAIMYDVEDDHWWYRTLRGILSNALRNAGLGPGSKILDVGCGTGANLAMLPKETQAVGIDFAPAAVHFCRQRGLHYTAAASALALPFADASFDAAFSCDVFCHKSIPNPVDALRETTRVLRPGGYVFLNLPAYPWLMSSHDAAVHTGQRFTRPQISQILRTCGLEAMKLTYWNTILFPAILPIRLWHKKFPPERSDLGDAVPSALNAAFTSLLRIEQALLRATSFPFGLSVFAVARRSGKG